MLKICCRQTLDSLEQTLWNVQVICTFLGAAFFVALLVVIQKVLPLNHKDAGMHFNEGSNVLNVLSTHISAKELRLQGSVKYSPKSSYIIAPTLYRTGRIRRRVSCVCGEWLLCRLIQHWSEASQSPTVQSQSQVSVSRTSTYVYCPFDMLRFSAVINTNKW